ncbi:hypothetical protein EC957_003961 [Mortierella hygrophila]|uniref:VASt domain-containing protein n=1 Tax=Mortierella hygrophila TaxID=979708 RepID=A0A9P6F2V6_9FUNG|nr:hypothetical protein EC957_003961 [Mortierella hygrophila]
MTGATNIHDTHPISNDTVPSVAVRQHLPLDSPDLPGSIVSPPSSTGLHLATPPYSLPEWITNTKLVVVVTPKDPSAPTMGLFMGGNPFQTDQHLVTIDQAQAQMIPNDSTALDSSAIHSSQSQNLIEPKNVGAGPTNCKCPEHYRYAILSTVVPMPLDVCFEWLYSSQGLGHEDHLVKKAHAIVNSSPHIEISPWAKPGLETSTADISGWETKKRQLHYSVTFKIPMFCLTLESPGMTRIRCFAEVKFKKSILWSSRIEASAMQGCGLYYKELLRELMEMEPTVLQESLHPVRPSVTRSNTSDSAQTNQQLQLSSIATNLATYNTTTSLEAAPVMARSSSQGFIGVSPAHSLLAQQYLKNPPTVSRTSTISTDNSAESIITSTTATSITSADSITPTGPSKLVALNRSASAIWKNIVQTSVELLSKPLSITVPSSKGQGTTCGGHDSCIQGDSDTVSEGSLPQGGNQSSTAVSSLDESPNTVVEADGSGQESTVTSTEPEILSKVESDADATVPRQVASPIQANMLRSEMNDLTQLLQIVRGNTE